MGKKIRKLDLTEICAEIENIIQTSDEKSIKPAYIDLMAEYYNALNNRLDFKQVDDLCNITLKIAKTKNRVTRYIEKDIWRDIPDFPFRLIQFNDFEIAEDEDLEPDGEYENDNKKILSRILKLGYDILELEDDKSKSSGTRRSGALKTIAELLDYYEIDDCKAVFIKSINSKYPKEQYEALMGLEKYYAATEDEIDAELLENLEKIFDETDDRTVASTCLQIKINAGLIGELSAVCSIDDWKDEHYK
jgi:hypothetical protein